MSQQNKKHSNKRLNAFLAVWLDVQLDESAKGRRRTEISNRTRLDLISIRALLFALRRRGISLPAANSSCTTRERLLDHAWLRPEASSSGRACVQFVLDRIRSGGSSTPEERAYLLVDKSRGEPDPVLNPGRLDEFLVAYIDVATDERLPVRYARVRTVAKRIRMSNHTCTSYMCRIRNLGLDFPDGRVRRQLSDFVRLVEKVDIDCLPEAALDMSATIDRCVREVVAIRRAEAVAIERKVERPLARAQARELFQQYAAADEAAA